ncbi:helix-turn-helix transcriptional regulator [Candidatus Bipolaricaulota bacterium]|nr:helix-turn-helix transcriptional regulator [Candidatus Bipolaricaulota bacterium]
MDLGRELKLWRLQQGLSKRAVAKLLGVSIPTLTRWEEGLVEPRDYNLQRIQDFLEERIKSLSAKSRS